ncbi:hypothetical protein N7532_010733 [Penicillium argentinense]|uniref:Tail specific protease domain-containing protein n=1 Tax=Penicillium argentinense TaxID=1131581 RepID=A0A9W9EQ55_9EURO|nr:uncharacterized protein N7532_010733 [Penicillium argentinense]KAJ5085962.1 hypothetical protein N7532_010733 [Penicillium argentinense]
MGLETFSNSYAVDALYNSVFYNDPLSVGSSAELKTSQVFLTSLPDWPGAYRAVHFANGTTSVFDAYVNILGSFTPKSAQELSIILRDSIPELLHCQFIGCMSHTHAHTRSLELSQAIQQRPKNRTMGFFPETDALKDTAVLAIISFKVDDLNAFAEVGRDFLNNATEMEKKNLIIDLSGNGGGTVFARLNLFRQLFTEEEIYLSTRFSANEASDRIWELLGHFDANETTGNIYGWKSQAKPDQKTGLDSWDDYYGPYNAMGVNSSAPSATNFTLVVSDPEGTTPLNGVRSIAFGGRPKDGPMQAIGGVKGSQVAKFSDFAQDLKNYAIIAKNATANGRPMLTVDQLQEWDQVIPCQLDEFPYKIQNGSVNQLSSFGRKNDRLPR